MLEPTYRQALGQAWKLVIGHKLLWIFGLLSVMLGQFGLPNFIGQLIALDQSSFFVSGDWQRVFTVAYWQPMMSVWSLWLFFVVVLLAALTLVVAVASEGALIAAAGEWFKRRKSPSLTSAWHKGVKHFWRLLAVKFLERLLLLVLLFLVGYLLAHFVVVDTWLNRFYMIVIFAAGFLVALKISVVAMYTSAYVVEDENTLPVALAKGRVLFARHTLVSLELSLLELLFSLFLVSVVIIGGVWLLIPSVYLTLLAGVTGFTNLINVGIYFSLSLYVLAVALMGAVFNAFMTSSWMFLFMKMHHEGVPSRIMHWLRRIFR